MLDAAGGPAALLGGLDLAYNLPGQTTTIDVPGSGAGQGSRIRPTMG